MEIMSGLQKVHILGYRVIVTGKDREERRSGRNEKWAQEQKVHLERNRTSSRVHLLLIIYLSHVLDYLYFPYFQAVYIQTMPTYC